MSKADYAGDVNPRTAWEMLSTDAEACLVDVRTDAEWRYVGLPRLDSLGRKTVCVSWLLFPDNRPNPGFIDEVREAGIRPDQTVLLICRSGQRSRDAAIALTGGGFARCFNVAEGFEGDRDKESHRGTIGGWKVAGLPWSQN